MSKIKKTKKTNYIKIILFLLALIYGYYTSQIDNTYSLPNVLNTFNESSDILTISYLDVGQADSILIESNNENMLIDAGNNEDGEFLVKYFKEKEITKFKYLVATHPHEDHIGGIDDVINNFEIETFFMSDVITTTKTFTDVLDAMENKNLTYTVPKIKDKYNLGDATIEVIYTGTNKQELNNTSIVLRMVYKDVSFLFTGDTEEKVEKIILNSSLNISSDVLKVSHHGSSSSTSNDFLNKVNPKYAIISVGTGNSYKHPEDITLNKLNSKNIKVYRTDLDGSIIVTTDGNNININTIKTNTNG